MPYSQTLIDQFKSEATGKIGYVCSCWDLLHAGHCLLLEFAKTHCDYLIAGLHRDPRADRPWKNEPIMSLEERRILLRSNRNVDKIIEYDDEIDHENILKQLNPDVRFLGSDYLDLNDFTGKQLPVKIVYCDRSHGWSSSSLRSRIYQLEKKKHENR